MARRKSLKISNIVAEAIAILLLLALVGGLVMYFSDNSNKDDPNRLIVTVNGKTVDGQAGGYFTNESYPLTVSINKSKYDVKIIANGSISFDVDIYEGNVLCYVAVGDDLTKGFDIVHTNGGFTVIPKGDIAGVLSESFPNMTVDMDKAVFENVHDLFLLVITADDATAKIGFTLDRITGVVLDKTEIIL